MYIKILFPDCAHGALVGNGFCNDESNNAACNYDGGDCCGSCIITDSCTECECLNENPRNVMMNASSNPLVGNGYCNDETNNVACNFDAGECCGSCISMDYCIDCLCLDQSNNATSFVNNPLVGDGICHDETNTPNCNFDGFDCCGSNVITDACVECVCHGKKSVDLQCPVLL